MANAYCLMMANAYRLIEDGEKLAAVGRPLGAIGSFQSGLDEMVRAYLLEKAVLLEDSDHDGWNNFWSQCEDRAQLLAVLGSDIHPEIYASRDSQEKYRRGFSLLSLDFTRNRFDGDRFLPPGGALAGFDTMDKAAAAYYEYVMGVYHGLNFYGLPRPATQVQTFWGLRIGAQNAKLVNP